jgi:hypothetical protein
MQSDASNTLVKLAKAVIEHAPEGGDAFWGIKFSDIEASLSASEPVAFTSQGQIAAARNGSTALLYGKRDEFMNVPLYAAPPAPSLAVKAGREAVAEIRRLHKLLGEHYRGKNGEPNLAIADALEAALSAQVQDVAGTVEAFDRDHPELYWHLAKGKITAGEPLYGAIITDIRGNELGDGESNICAIDAFNIAVDDAALPAAPAKQEG